MTVSSSKSNTGMPRILDTRLRLHQRFSVNPYRWQSWVFDHFDLPRHARILELGCGPGALWVENLARIPTGWQITLSNSSAGMLAQTRQNLAGKGPFEFRVIDAQSIPLDAGQFDAVIANHMLYHVPDKRQAFSEVRRVLKPSGIFFASTNGESHLKELSDLIGKFDSQLTTWGGVSASFTLENGTPQLSEWFPRVTLYRYQDALDVTEVDPLVEYVLSGSAAGILGEKPIRFRQFVARQMRSQNGVIHITRQASLFVCSQY